MSDSLPKRYGDFPAVVKAAALANDARTRLYGLEERMVELTAVLDGKADEDTKGLAERFLQGESLASLRADAGTIVAELANARAELRVLREASKLADARLKQAEKVALAEALPPVKKAYQAIVGRLASLLCEIGQTAKEEAAFRADYYDGELRLFVGYLQAMPLPLDRDRIRAWLAEAAAHDLVSAKVVEKFCG
jgi:hypothetical protein